MSIFRRRVPLRRLRYLREFLWPSSGWHRSTRYLAHRVRRLPGTPYRIAAGFASGAAIGMTPFLGCQFVLAGLLAWMLRGNILASALGTFVCNPWTFPLICVWTYRLGNWMMGELGHDDPPMQLTLGFLVEHPWRILLPMAVGAVPTGVVVWGITYGLVYLAVVSYRKARRTRLAAYRERFEASRRSAGSERSAGAAAERGRP